MPRPRKNPTTGQQMAMTLSPGGVNGVSTDGRGASARGGGGELTHHEAHTAGFRPCDKASVHQKTAGIRAGWTH